MSKQPHVWVVESSDDGKTWIPVQSSLFQDRAKEIAVTVAENFYGADYRVAKYVRVEPTAKPRKIRTTMIKLGPGKFVEKDLDAAEERTEDMSPKAQRIAIHKARGLGTTAYRFWFTSRVHQKRKESPHYHDEETAQYWAGKEAAWSEVSQIEPVESHENTPNYLNDLNAMHEAEKVLTGGQLPKYFGELTKLCGKPMMSLRHQQYLGVVTATAAQRAEAFLRTLNLWTP